MTRCDLCFAAGPCLACSAGADGAALQVNRTPVELTIAQVGERTVHLTVSPLDEQGRPPPDPVSTVLVPFDSAEKLGVRELAAARDVQAGRLRVRIEPQPLTVTIRRADDRLVQQLTIDENDGSVGFRTEAPVFGLGEGR